VPIPYAQHLEAAALPGVDRITAAVRDVVQGKDVVAAATRGE
jgi:pyruvate/2-oxoglutarate/acetoin dehydrogenase E1 component